MSQLSGKVRTLFDGKNFAVPARPSNRTAGRTRRCVWAKADGDDILFALPKKPPQDRQLEPGSAGDRSDLRSCQPV